MAIEIIGVDGDDTLWHSEGHFHVTEQRYVELLAPWVDAETASAALLESERRNLAVFGYGVKGFTLSMIETALTLTGHRIDGIQHRAHHRAGQGAADATRWSCSTASPRRSTCSAATTGWC